MDIFGYNLSFGPLFTSVKTVGPSTQDTEQAKKYNLTYNSGSGTWQWKTDKWPYYADGQLKYRASALKDTNTADLNDSIWYANQWENERQIEQQKIQEQVKASAAASSAAKAAEDKTTEVLKLVEEAKTKAETPTDLELQVEAAKRALAQKQAEAAQKLKEIQEMQQKQVAYSRDIEQKYRPKSASYATESEKIMGGQSGYYAMVKKPATTLQGYRRPGYLAGIIANWKQRD